MISTKVCPVCNARNEPSMLICYHCCSDISNVSPEEGKNTSINSENKASKQDNPQTIQGSASLTLRTTDGITIEVGDGGIIGRNAVGENILKDHKNISRQHARFSCKGDRWFIEDLNSANGTYVNGKKISPRKKVEITANTKLSLSNSFTLFIEIPKMGVTEYGKLALSSLQNFISRQNDMTIMFTDLEDSVAFFENKGTILAKSWLQKHDDILSSVINSHNGIILKKTGDGMLALFDKVESAVFAAIMIQRSLAEHNKVIDEDERYFIRISLNVGKVLYDGRDVYGNVINIASRIEGLAMPGQILTSEFINKNINKRSGIQLRFIGKKALKGIRKEIGIYEIMWNESAKS